MTCVSSRAAVTPPHSTGHLFGLRRQFRSSPPPLFALHRREFGTRLSPTSERASPAENLLGSSPPPPTPHTPAPGGQAGGRGGARARGGAAEAVAAAAGPGRAGAAPPGRSAEAGGRSAGHGPGAGGGAAQRGAGRWHAARRHAALPARCPADMDRRRLPPLLPLLLCAALGAAGRLSARPGNEGEPRPGRVPPGTGGWGDPLRALTFLAPPPLFLFIFPFLIFFFFSPPVKVVRGGSGSSPRDHRAGSPSPCAPAERLRSPLRKERPPPGAVLGKGGWGRRGESSRPSRPRGKLAKGRAAGAVPRPFGGLRRGDARRAAGPGGEVGRGGGRIADRQRPGSRLLPARAGGPKPPTGARRPCGQGEPLPRL